MKIESKHTIRMYSTIGRRAPCIGAPIFDFSGNVVAAVSVAWLSFRFDLSREGEWALELMNATALISGRMGFDDKA